jgi:hypothetical protein
MHYRQVSPRSNPTVNINYYSENKFGVDLIETQIGIIDSLSIVIIYIDKKIIHSNIVHL